MIFGKTDLSRFLKPRKTALVASPARRKAPVQGSGAAPIFRAQCAATSAKIARSKFRNTGKGVSDN